MPYFPAQLPLIVLIPCGLLLPPVGCSSNLFKIDGWLDTVSTKYLNYNETTTLLHEISSEFPSLVRLYSLGKSVEGREMWALNMRINVQQPRPLLVPPMQLAGNIHGDESVGRSLILMLAVDLLKGYNSNRTTVTYLLNTTDIHLIPSLNPDGYEAAHARHASKGECYPDPDLVGRLNHNGIDLNRNFPDQFDELVTPTREIETANIMKHIKSNHFVLSLNFHAGAWVASYPFDSTPLFQERCGDTGESHTSDEPVFIYLARLYASHHEFMGGPMPERCKESKDPSDSRYVKDFPDGITNGAEWYTVYGSMQDYTYLHSNCFEITIQVTCCKFPHRSQLHHEWHNNQRAIYKLMLATHMGIKGIAVDHVGDVIGHGKVFVDGTGHPVRTTAQGEYWRLTLPGRMRYKIVSQRGGREHESHFLFQTAERVPRPNAEEETTTAQLVESGGPKVTTTLTVIITLIFYVAAIKL